MKLGWGVDDTQHCSGSRSSSGLTHGRHEQHQGGPGQASKRSLSWAQAVSFNGGSGEQLAAQKRAQP